MIAGKDPRLLVRSQEPFNAEPPREVLRHSFITPVPLFFVRNHGAVPAVDPGAYRVSVGGLVRRAASYRPDELRARFGDVTVVATLQCAGNRRQELMAVRPIEGEIPWDAQAIGTAEWTGVRLRDVLEDAGIAAPAAHVAFLGLDAIEHGGRTEKFGGSIPLAKALGAEILVAHAMNGRPLTPIHGSPLRVVVPGYIGARSVKWLEAITVRADPSENYFQAHSYKLFPPEVTPDIVDWATGVMLGEVGINAVICRPLDGETVRAGALTCMGYALSGRHEVARVELSIDEGATWTPAALKGPSERWAWRFWETSLALPPGHHALVVRATDAAGGSQPENPALIWNFKGYMNAARHRIGVRAA